MFPFFLCGLSLLVVGLVCCYCFGFAGLGWCWWTLLFVFPFRFVDAWCLVVWCCLVCLRWVCYCVMCVVFV